MGWEQRDQDDEELRLYFSTLGEGSSLKIEGPTDENNTGNFQKRVHLLD